MSPQHHHAITPRLLGHAHVRVDGPAKVSGTAIYASDVILENVAHAALVLSPIARGRILQFDLQAVGDVKGVLGTFTYHDFAGAIAPVKHLMEGGYANSSHLPLGSASIAYAGQIVALVVAEMRETAEAAAALVEVTYEEDAFAATFDDCGAEVVRLATLKPEHDDPAIGDADAAFAKAEVKIEGRYDTPVQHHNPMELFTTTCSWDGPLLMVREPTRYGVAVKHGLAAQLGIDADLVRVITGPIGGHFGSKLALSQHTALVALAAKRLARPVSLVPTREQCFSIATYRPETRHTIRLGAHRDGRFTALVHEAEMTTSRFDTFAMEGTDVTASLYACPNVRTDEQAVRVDRNTPGPMRAPPEVPYLFALESAVDEMACALDMDPIELRRRNDTTTDPISGKPFSTRPLMRCFETGAKAFGWERRKPRPGSITDGPWRIGFGCASSARPVKISPASMRITLAVDGSVTVATAQHEIGTGITTLLAMGAADGFGVPITAVTVRLGDTSSPAAGLSGGSSTTTSLLHTLAGGCQTLRDRLARAVVADDGPLAGADAKSLRFEDATLQAPDGRVVGIGVAVALIEPSEAQTLAEFTPSGSGDKDFAAMHAGHISLTSSGGANLTWAFGAQFAELRIHSGTGEIRVARMLGAFAAGRVLNPMTAHSQLTGAMIWGLGSALLEETIIDDGRYLNANLSDYLVATAADAPSVEALMVADDDQEVNALGIKGLGELGIIGMNAAIANAVFNATGNRMRRLPILIEELL